MEELDEAIGVLVGLAAQPGADLAEARRHGEVQERGRVADNLVQP